MTSYQFRCNSIAGIFDRIKIQRFCFVLLLVVVVCVVVCVCDGGGGVCVGGVCVRACLRA